MNVEFGLNNNNPFLSIKGLEFKKAISDDKKSVLLGAVIRSLAIEFETDDHYYEQVNNVILSYLEDDSVIFYQISNINENEYIYEIYIKNNNSIQFIVKWDGYIYWLSEVNENE